MPRRTIEWACTGEAGEISDGSVRGCAIRCLTSWEHVFTVRHNSLCAPRLRSELSAVQSSDGGSEQGVQARSSLIYALL